MPPKARITEEMIIDAAFEIVRSSGAENINARAVAQKLNCSTQPVMYHFETIEQLKRTVYAKATQCYAQFVKSCAEGEKLTLDKLCAKHIFFAAEQPRLFRFLFLSPFFDSKAFFRLPLREDMQPVLQDICEKNGLSREQATEAFMTAATYAHGYAGMVACDGGCFDRQEAQRHVEAVCAAIIEAAKQSD